MQNAKKNITSVRGVLRIQFTYTVPTARATGMGETRMAPTMSPRTIAITAPPKKSTRVPHRAAAHRSG